MRIRLLCLAILALAAVRLYSVISDELRLQRNDEARKTRMPSYGSFQGVDATTGLMARIDLQGTGRHGLIFGIRADIATADKTFWHEVDNHLAIEKLSVELVGICDTGGGCGEAHPEARFTVLGFLPPYQMRIVAMAHDAREALLYDASHTLKARLPVSQSPSAMASTIAQHLRNSIGGGG